MANNRMYLQCKDEGCPGAICIAKFYPSGGFIAGEGAGWFQYEDAEFNFVGRLNKFFEEHQHEHDFSSFGGYQYELVYEVAPKEKETPLSEEQS